MASWDDQNQKIEGWSLGVEMDIERGVDVQWMLKSMVNLFFVAEGMYLFFATKTFHSVKCIRFIVWNISCLFYAFRLAVTLCMIKLHFFHCWYSRFNALTSFSLWLYRNMWTKTYASPSKSETRVWKRKWSIVLFHGRVLLMVQNSGEPPGMVYTTL